MNSMHSCPIAFFLQCGSMCVQCIIVDSTAMLLQMSVALQTFGQEIVVRVPRIPEGIDPQS